MMPQPKDQGDEGGVYARFPALITELLAAKVDVLVTAGTPATIARRCRCARAVDADQCGQVDFVGYKKIADVLL